MALTLPSSNGAKFFVNPTRSDNHQRTPNSHFNGGHTQTTSTLTPTRLKNIEESFHESDSLLPTKPFHHELMAGFVPPKVNIILVKQSSSSLNLESKPVNNNTVEYFSNNSNTDDSAQFSDGYSSETNSSTVQDLNFGTFFHDMSTTVTRSKSKHLKTVESSNESARYSSPAPSTTTAMASSSQRARKSTGGGRKPTKNEKLSPEEEMKREKRRERNKQAAARCRKRRLDQTNELLNTTQQLDKEHRMWVENVQKGLDELKRLKAFIMTHNCKMSNIIRGTPNVMAQINFEDIQAAMEPLPEDEDEEDLETISETHNNNSNSSTTFSYSNMDDAVEEPKVKRPKTLCTSMFDGNSGGMQTPSKGFSFADFQSLTPIMPSLTPNQTLPTPLFNSVLHSTMSSP